MFVTFLVIGLVLSAVASLLLVIRAQSYDNPLYTLSFAVFGASLICLYLASTLYHSATDHKARSRLRIVDHATIFILIAGTYTPFCLITLSGPTGWTVFAVSWGLATVGVILKVFFTGRFQLLSTLMYVFMEMLTRERLNDVVVRRLYAALRHHALDDPTGEDIQVKIWDTAG